MFLYNNARTKFIDNNDNRIFEIKLRGYILIPFTSYSKYCLLVVEKGRDNFMKYFEEIDINDEECLLDY